MKKYKVNLTRHGGGERAGKRKIARPIHVRKLLHVTFRSSRARGKWNFLLGKNALAIEKSLQTVSRRFGVKVRRFQNVGNHFHLLIQGKSRADIQNFLRLFPQLVMFSITNARKGTPVGKFWDDLAFSRVVEWGRDWRNVHNYLEKNKFEALGMPRDVVDLWFHLEPA